jgi:nitroreductase
VPTPPQQGRRRWLAGATGLGALAVAGGGAAAYLRSRDNAAYAAALAESRAPATAGEAAQRVLVRHGAMAANGHNAQPWRFALLDGAIEVRPDRTRRTPVVDPDDHHLHASLGCAVENMVQAAPALGLHATPSVAEEGHARLLLDRAAVIEGPLSAAIPRRQSTRTEYDGAPLPTSELRALEAAGRGDGVEVVLVTDDVRRETLLDLVVAGNASQMRDPAFVAELLAWVRFSPAEAVARRDGLFAGSSGNPAVPAPLGRLLFPHVFTLAAETDRHVRQMRSSAGLAIFVAERNAPTGWLQAGRCAQRFCLQATALGIRTAWMNQPVEVPGLRAALAAWIGAGPRRPNLVLRFGRGPELTPSLRRPVAEILVADGRSGRTRAA